MSAVREKHTSYFSNAFGTERPALPDSRDGVWLSILCQTYDPDTSATGQLLTDLAEGLSELGKRVRVYAGQPTYCRTGHLPRRVVRNGVEILRSFNTRFCKDFKLGRIVNSITFVLSILPLVVLSRHKSPILVVTSPPILPFVAYFAYLLWHRRYVLLIHDLYPDVATVVGYLSKGCLVERLWTALNRRVIARAESVIVLSDDMRKAVGDRFDGVSDGKVVCVHNWADGERIVPIRKSSSSLALELGVDKSFVVQYSGNMGLLHDLETVMEAAAKLVGEDIVFLMIGGGVKRKKLERMAARLGAVNVRFLPYQPKERLKHSLCCADASIVTLKRGAEGLAVPCKFYGILASGRPVIALVPWETDIARTVTEFACGCVVEPGDADGLAQAVLRLKRETEECNRMGRRARECFEHSFTRRRAIERYHELLSRLARG